MAPPPHPLTGYLGAGAVWSGDLSFEGRVRVDGTFKGRIYSEGILEVGASGRGLRLTQVLTACGGGAPRMDGPASTVQRTVKITRLFFIVSAFP